LTRVGASASDPTVKASAFVLPTGPDRGPAQQATRRPTSSRSTPRVLVRTSRLYRTSGSSERAAAIPFGASSIALPGSAIATVVLAP
jgi:hypothetical protein